MPIIKIYLYVKQAACVHWTPQKLQYYKSNATYRGHTTTLIHIMCDESTKAPVAPTNTYTHSPLSSLPTKENQSQPHCLHTSILFL